MKIGIILIYAVIILGAVTGWGKNVYELTQLDFKEPFKAEVIRSIGVPVFPMGAIIGYIDIED